MVLTDEIKYNKMCTHMFRHKFSTHMDLQKVINLNTH